MWVKSLHPGGWWLLKLIARAVTSLEVVRTHQSYRYEGWYRCNWSHVVLRTWLDDFLRSSQSYFPVIPWLLQQKSPSRWEWTAYGASEPGDLIFPMLQSLIKLLLPKSFLSLMSLIFSVTYPRFIFPLLLLQSELLFSWKVIYTKSFK